MWLLLHEPTNHCSMEALTQDNELASEEGTCEPEELAHAVSEEGGNLILYHVMGEIT